MFAPFAYRRTSELVTRILEAISKKIGERSKSLQEPASILLTRMLGKATRFPRSLASSASKEPDSGLNDRVCRPISGLSGWIALT